MGRTPVRSRTAQRMREDQQRARKAAENAHNRAMLATYTFNEVSPEQYLAYQQNRTNRVADFDVEAFSQYNDLRSQEFAREFSANLRDYNQELRASPNKNRQLQQWGVRNRTLYCAELTDMICDESARNLGFSEYSNVTACRNRDYCPTVAMDLHQRCRDCCVEGGYTGSIKSKIKELQEENPYGCYLAIVGSQGNRSGSGLHQVMIAPTLDENNNFVMDDDGKPKMSVYSFNNERITDLNNYNKDGTIYNLCEFAEDNALRQIENGTLTPAQIQQYVETHGLPMQNQQNEQTAPGIVAQNGGNHNQMNDILWAAMRERARG